MVGRISKVSHIPDLPYEVHLIDDPKIVNAMCAPGGKVMVFSGLYKGKDAIVKDDDELAVVLGHEIAHATCRHVTESQTREMPLNLVLMGGAIYADAKGNEEAATWVAAAFIAAQGLIFPKYSRRDEAEADAVGLMYAAKAGYDPRAAPRLWKHVYEEQGDSPALLAFFSSHPSNKDRWKALEKQLPAALVEYEKAGGKL
jgi:predicted Zn-dependent protease